MRRSPDVDPVALNLFLQFRYTPSPLTIFQGIRKLAPGTMLVVEEGSCREERWYDYTPVPFDEPQGGRGGGRELLDLYSGAVKRHLLSDVPVGILLSGGLDSGLLLALMNEHGSDWPAYTVGYGETFEDDELADAAETARLLGAPSHPGPARSRGVRTLVAERSSAASRSRSPSSSIVPMYFVCQRARQDVKVALIGQGPDELFCGYKRHLGVRYGDSWRGLPRPCVRLSVSAVSAAAAQRDAEARRCPLGIDDRLAALPARVLAGAAAHHRRPVPRGRAACQGTGTRRSATGRALRRRWSTSTSSAASSFSRSARRCPTNC